MKRLPILVVSLLTSTIMAGAYAAPPSDNASGQKPESGAAKIADKDFGHLSTDGVSAFEDIHLARMAIYDGHPEEAAKLAADAQASLGKAKTDDTVFMKAESALRAPAQAATQPPASPQKNGNAVAWIPIDSQILLGETYQPTPEKAAAVVTAKKNLQKGEGSKALETLRLAAIDVNYVVAVAPLEQSITDIDQANKLIASHDYYGASQALRQAEAGVRYDEIDDVANVKGKGKTANAKSK